MAHVGKNYPVHFRRDFNFNCANNNAGFARAYNVQFGGASGTIGTALASKPLVAIAADETTFSGMKWLVAPTVRAGHIVHLQMATVPPPPTVDILVHCELFDSVLGSLGIAQFAALNLFSYRTFNIRWDPLSFTHPALFAIGSAGFTQCVFVSWPQWNNL